MQTEWVTTSTILNDLRDYENHAAWRRFVERFHGPVVRFARGAGLADADAEEVAQEAMIAFAEAYRNGGYDRTKGRLSAWLFGILYNHIRRHRQKAARQAARATPIEQTTFWRELPDEAAARTEWDREWEQAVWSECLERVRQEFEPLSLAAFELVVRDELSAAEAAEKLGVPIKTVYNAKHRVLKRMRELRADLEIEL